MEDKTNVMRILDKKKIPYRWHSYDSAEAISGMEVAEALGQDADMVFKTLVTVGRSGEHYVFMVPVNRELDLKKAAKAAGEKKVELIPQKELLPLTGYIHGGCSPIGMKKQFPTVLHETAAELPRIMFSAGKIGYQIETAPEELKRIVNYRLADVCE